MENHDYLMNQLEALGEALRKLLSKVSLLKESEATDIQIAEIDDLMKSGIGHNLHDIASLTNEAFLATLLAKKLKAADLSNMINLLVEFAMIKKGITDKYKSNELLDKALFLDNYLATNQKTVYFKNIVMFDEASRLRK